MGVQLLQKTSVDQCVWIARHAGITETTGLPYYLEADVKPYRSVDADALYDPAPSLPPDSELVVRTSELRKIETDSLHLAETKPPHHSIEKPLGQRERATLLTIISVLAEAAGIDLSKTSKAGETIEAMTDANGVRVAARTVEDHLKRIPDGYKGPFIKGKHYVETVTEDDDEEAASSEESNQTY